MVGVALRLFLLAGLLAACSSKDAPPDDGNDPDESAAGSNGSHDAGSDAAVEHTDPGDTSAFDAGHDPDRNQVEAGHVCERWAAIECAGEAACCTHAGRDAAQCRQIVEQTCTDALLLDALSSAAGVGFDPNLASVAFAELERRASVCDPLIASWAASRDGFGASFTGSLGKTDDCEPDGGLSAATVDLAAALASCQVSQNLACLPSAKAWTCTPRSGRGGVCFTDLNCADGLYCDNPLSSFDGMCSERLASGETCTDATQCASFLCEDGACASDDDVQAAYCL